MAYQCVRPTKIDDLDNELERLEENLKAKEIAKSTGLELRPRSYQRLRMAQSLAQIHDAARRFRTVVPDGHTTSIGAE